MCISIIKRCLFPFVVLGAALASTAALAHDAVVLSEGFQVCIRGVAGLTFESKEGIDAVEGRIRAKKETIEFMVSRNPAIPPAMKLKPDKVSLIARQLSGDMAFIAESIGPHDVGTERLYAFSMRNETTPVGPIQDQIFVQLWSDGHRQNNRLVKTVGDALYRCH